MRRCRAILTLLVQCGIACALGIGIIAFSWPLGYVVEHPIPVLEWPFDRTSLVVAAVSWAIVTGVWLRAALPHQKMRHAWGVTLIAVMGVLFGSECFAWIIEKVNATRPIATDFTAPVARFSERFWLSVASGVGLTCVAWVGVAPGSGVRWLNDQLRSRRWRARRRRLRSGGAS